MARAEDFELNLRRMAKKGVCLKKQSSLKFMYEWTKGSNRK